jgi:hypothetical protein
MLAMTAVKYDAKIVTTQSGRDPINSEEIYTLDATIIDCSAAGLKHRHRRNESSMAKIESTRPSPIAKSWP